MLRSIDDYEDTRLSFEDWSKKEKSKERVYTPEERMLIYSEAYKLLKKHGMVKHLLGKDWKGYCLFGALSEACDRLGFVITSGLTDEVSECIGGALLDEWNDKSKRKVGELLQVYETLYENNLGRSVAKIKLERLHQNDQKFTEHPEA